ncbi:MAG TPA: MBL fold metallo-hydrolase [Nitrospirota bacterium]|nr:MBL fold metallo-hydrolase [Nitrospirota bacterium]
MNLALSMMLAVMSAADAAAQEQFEKDAIRTSAGDLEIVFIGHSSLMMRFSGKTLYVDPYSRLADYAKLPKADLILITHEHQDHLDLSALEAIRTSDMAVILTGTAAEKLPGGTVMKNGEVRAVLGITIEAVPAYNLVHKRANGEPFHPKGQGNGYVLSLGDKRVYIAGDTENTPEMKALKSIDIAFLPMNLPYTMTPEMVADAAKAFKPHVLYPYHYGDTDTSRIVSLLSDDRGVEVRIRKLK